MIIVILILLGLCFGSFVNALVFRLHMQAKKKSKIKNQRSKYSILRGRSLCPNCKHTLAWYDLLPVISWVSLKGKCRYCKKPISWQYPAVELATAGIFVLSYIYWPKPLEGLETVIFGLWLATLVGLIALIVYDLRWMLLPNKIIFVLYGFAAAMVLVRVIQEQSASPIANAATGILVGGGIFYLLFQVSDGRWIGGGDVKLGFLLGALVGLPLQAMLLLFIASFLGCLVAVPLMATGKAKRTTRIPFGPFLIVAGIIVMLFGQLITDWYIDTLTLSA